MTKRSNVSQRLHIGLTVLCAGALVVLGVFYADGWIEFRSDQRTTTAPAPVNVNVTPKDPGILAVPIAEQFGGMLGDEAFCYEFEGVWIDCWIEVEIDGETQRLGERTAEHVRFLLKGREEYDDPPRGYVMWVIHNSGDTEIWSVAVAILNNEGEVATTSRSRGITAPEPDPRPRGVDQTRLFHHSLTGDRPIPLVTQWLVGDGDGTFKEKTKRKVQFMCQPAK